MTLSISTQALTGAMEDPACVVVDVREMAAFNGWRFHHEARGGHLRGAVAFPLEWTAVVQGTALQHLLASKRITPHRTVVVYDVQRHRSVAMAHRLRALGYARVLTYDAGVVAWAADQRLPMAHLAHYEKLIQSSLARPVGARPVCRQPILVTGSSSLRWGGRGRHRLS